jgi:hypothetical protein
MDLFIDRVPGSSRGWLGVAAVLGLMLALGSSAGSVPGGFSRLIRQTAPSLCFRNRN